MSVHLENLKRKIIIFMDLDESNELKQAQKIVNRHATLHIKIKDDLKKLGITEISATTDTHLYELMYKISEYDRIDPELVPEEVRDACTYKQQVWRKNSTKTKIE
jgi:hypothetical protein